MNKYERALGRAIVLPNDKRLLKELVTKNKQKKLIYIDDNNVSCARCNKKYHINFLEFFKVNYCLSCGQKLKYDN